MRMKRNSNRLQNLTLGVQSKKIRAREKVVEALEQLQQEQKSINFRTVAIRAGVSRNFLYQDPEIREKIKKLRDSGAKQLKLREMENKLKQLEKENNQLRSQIKTGQKEPAILDFKVGIKQ